MSDDKQRFEMEELITRISNTFAKSFSLYFVSLGTHASNKIIIRMGWKYLYEGRTSGGNDRLGESHVGGRTDGGSFPVSYKG